MQGVDRNKDDAVSQGRGGFAVKLFNGVKYPMLATLSGVAAYLLLAVVVVPMSQPVVAGSILLAGLSSVTVAIYAAYKAVAVFKGAFHVHESKGQTRGSMTFRETLDYLPTNPTNQGLKDNPDVSERDVSSKPGGS